MQETEGEGREGGGKREKVQLVTGKSRRAGDGDTGGINSSTRGYERAGREGGPILLKQWRERSERWGEAQFMPEKTCPY
eukprot:7095264-Prorocentrum_lima.AAC.1